MDLDSLLDLSVSAMCGGDLWRDSCHARGMPRVSETSDGTVCAQHGRGPDGVQVPCARVEHRAVGSLQALAEVKVAR